MLIATINEPQPGHLAVVQAEMRTLGGPTLRAIYDRSQDVVLLLEGSHRWAAASALGLPVHLIGVPDDAPLSPAEIGYDDCGFFDGESTTAGMLRDRIASPRGTYAGCPLYEVSDDLADAIRAMLAA